MSEHIEPTFAEGCWVKYTRNGEGFKIINVSRVKFKQKECLQIRTPYECTLSELSEMIRRKEMKEPRLE